MPFVKNVSDKKIVQTLGGIETVFEPGKYVPFTDRASAVWHTCKAEVVASPADGRKGSRPLVLFEDSEVSDKELRAQVEPPKSEPMVAPPSTFVPPTPGHVAKPDAETSAIMSRKALNQCDKDLLVQWTKKHGLYKPYMDKSRMVDALASIGFKPPAALKR